VSNTCVRSSSDLCSAELLHQPRPVGSQGHTVAIDETDRTQKARQRPRSCRATTVDVRGRWPGNEGILYAACSFPSPGSPPTNNSDSHPARYHNLVWPLGRGVRGFLMSCHSSTSTRRSTTIRCTWTRLLAATQTTSSRGGMPDVFEETLRGC